MDEQELFDLLDETLRVRVRVDCRSFNCKTFSKILSFLSFRLKFEIEKNKNCLIKTEPNV